ncbi:MAG: SDR family NAD(P)-dependent oxidoreductase [Phycisphaerales bacterium]|nr:SDR family NAD(P)-dependent oxidoreductase [Phycisphaerales bacterium]
MHSSTQIKPLDSRIALITGASAGIGRQCAHHLASMGAKLILNARRQQNLIKLTQELNENYPTNDNSPRSTFIAGDAANQSTIDKMMAATAQLFNESLLTPPIPDIIIVNAGRGLNGSVMTSDTNQWEEMVRTNLLGAARLIRTAGIALQKLQESRNWPEKPADLVILGSTVGRHISPFSSMYGSTKFAVNSLAEAARRELGPKGVRVSLIEPGIVKSEFQQVAGYDEDNFGDLMDTISPVLSPMDIARTIAFIISQPPGMHISDVVIRSTRQEYP